MALYTFISEYAGGTYIRQVEADALMPACTGWADQIVRGKDIPDLKESEFREAFQEDIVEFPPIAIDTTVNVWYMSLLVEDELLSVNIVRTDAATEQLAGESTAALHAASQT
jgi:hypothetical protein